MTETCTATDHQHHEGSNYYATAIKDGNANNVALLAGPYRTHGEALDILPTVRRLADDLDPRAPWYSYGTVAMAADFTRVRTYEQGCLR